MIVSAEIGINHNGDIERAKKMIEAAKEVGCDNVKFQFYRTEDFIFDKTLTMEWTQQGMHHKVSQRDFFEAFELSRSQMTELAAYCRNIGIDWGATPTNALDVEVLKELGADFIKNGSDMIRNITLIRAMGASKLPVILSTGMAHKQEITAAMDACFYSSKGIRPLLLHCTSEYPCPTEHVNMRKMLSLPGRPVGLSDHTRGNTAAIMAVAMGAIWIEKHFTLSHELWGPDHGFSLTPCEMKNYVYDIREAEKMLGGSTLKPTYHELEQIRSWKEKRYY